MEDPTPDTSKKLTTTADSNSARQVGAVDDDDIVDRLLVVDDLPPFATSSAAHDFADIDINPGQEVEEQVADLAEFSAPDEHMQRVESIDELSTPELEALEQVEALEEFADFDDAGDCLNAAVELIETPPIIAADTQALPAGFEEGAELAALASQIIALQAQQQHIGQTLAEKADKTDVLAFQNEIGYIKTEQKKSRRTAQPNPVVGRQSSLAAYLAGGLAVIALAGAAGLGFMLQQADQRINELQETTAKLQEQVSAPVSPDNTAALEALQKKLDELSATDKTLGEQINEINKTLKHEAVSSKTTVTLGKQLAGLSTQNKQTDAALQALENKLAALEKVKAAAAAAQAATSVAVAAKPDKKIVESAAEQWFVSLVAFKQDWYAKRIADEYAGKGVPAKVSKTQAKGENWYRLSVDGFKNQNEANAYAAKVKKTLNLDSVLVMRSNP